jgi:hypothetical protein
MSVLLEEYNIVESYEPSQKHYLILNEEKSITQAQELAIHLRNQ